MGDDRRRVGLLGCGTVGSEVARLLIEDPRLSARYELAAVAVRDPLKPRVYGINGSLVGPDPVTVAGRADVDVVVEVMGGLDPAFHATATALDRGVPVVSANKALFAEHGPELRARARRSGTVVRFEASVAAAVPVIEVLRQLVRTDRATRVEGVLNGTCNYVLSEIERTGVSFDEAVAKAQELGYAEADPSRDLDGTDAADKLAVLAQLAWDLDVRSADVERLGIDTLTADDLARARAAGRTWRLVAAATAEGCLTVEPRDLRANHPLARLDGADNGVAITSRYTGTITMMGAGAGGLPTASAVIADLDRVTTTTDRAGALVGV